MPLKLVRRAGRASYYVRGELAGVRVYRATGTSDREIAEAIRVKAEQRILREVAYGKQAVMLFDDAALSYDRSGAPMRFIFDIRKSDGAERGLAPYFRGRRLVDITQSDLIGAARALYPKATRETLIRQVYTPFVAVWNHAVRKQWAEPRIWERPRKAKGTLARPMVRRSGASPVTYERAAIFVAAMSPAPAMLMTALFYTGMRPIEIFTLRGGDIDVTKRWITLLATKSGEPRGVPIHDFLAPLFESLLQRKALASDARIFRTPRGEPYQIVGQGGGGLKSAIDGARRRSGITDISPYTARHTVSTQLVVNGVHPHVKDQILGHAKDSMSRRYTHVPQQPLIDAINTLPVLEAWRAMPWLRDPLAWSGRLVEGTGRRNDLRRP